MRPKLAHLTRHVRFRYKSQPLPSFLSRCNLSLAFESKPYHFVALPCDEASWQQENALALMEAGNDQPDEPQRDEQELIAAVLAGQTQLFHELIRPHERSVFAMAMSLLKDEADAEDAMQETFLKAFHNLASFRGDAKFSTWLISIVLNEARSKLRRKKLVSLDVEPDDDSPGSFSPALLRDWREVPSEALERQEMRLLLQESIAALPDGYRVVFLLREVEELSTHEAAAMLQMSESALKVRLHRARMMLQKDLAPKLKHISLPPTSNTKRRWFPWS